ncbi:MAG: hypothetical protein ACOX02_00485 [Acholeplasmatales bacterium]
MNWTTYDLNNLPKFLVVPLLYVITNSPVAFISVFVMPTPSAPVAPTNVSTPIKFVQTSLPT